MDADEEEPEGTAEALPDVESTDVPAIVGVLGHVENLVYYGVAVVLAALAFAALGRTVVDFVAHGVDFGHRMTNVVNGVLFVVIVLELLRTTLAHFSDSTFHLKPFLIIGIISVVRHILTVGAQLSLNEDQGDRLFQRTDVELGVNAAVVLALVLGLILVRKTE